MTIDELKRLDDKYGDGAEALCDMQDIIDEGNILCDENRISDKSMPFWSRILDSISDEYVKELVYEVFSEYIYYRERDHFDDFDEVSKAYLEDRCFVFDFKPGDFIATKYGKPEKVISVTMNHAGCYPVINTEQRYVEERVVKVKNEIKYSNIDQYYKVEDVQTYSLVNSTGEDWEDYWD